MRLGIGRVAGSASLCSQPEARLALEFPQQRRRGLHCVPSPRGYRPVEQLLIGDARVVGANRFGQIKGLFELAADRLFRVEPAAPAKVSKDRLAGESFLLWSQFASTQSLAQGGVGGLAFGFPEDIRNDT